MWGVTYKSAGVKATPMKDNPEINPKNVPIKLKTLVFLESQKRVGERIKYSARANPARAKATVKSKNEILLGPPA